jgi:hypothetical protein
VGIAWKAHKDLYYSQNWGGRAISQGLRTIPSLKKDWMDVLGLNKWEVWPA